MFGNAIEIRYQVYNPAVYDTEKCIYSTEEYQSFVPRIKESVFLPITKQKYEVMDVIHHPSPGEGSKPYIIVKLLENP